MSASEMKTLREGVGLTNLGHMVVLRVTGPGAFVLLDRLSTAPLYLREGQMRQTLFLDEAARPFADVLIASDEGGFWVLAEGPPEVELLAYVERHGRNAAGPAEVQVEPLGATHELWGLNGPYAWEVASALLGPAVLGMTYLSLLAVDDVLCLRGGKTGEYGYDLLVRREAAAELRQRLDRAGLPRGMGPVGLATLDQAALENWHFNIRTLGAEVVTPIELQLQWRVGYEREFVGAAALRARRAQGAARRALCFTASAEVTPGDRVALAGAVVGAVLAAGWSHSRDEWVGSALVDVAYAHPQIEAFRVQGRAGEVPIRTRTPPLLNNRSLYVDPHSHAYQTRAVDTFPDLVLP